MKMTRSKGRKKGLKQELDMVAAAVILQSYLMVRPLLAANEPPADSHGLWRLPLLCSPRLPSLCGLIGVCEHMSTTRPGGIPRGTDVERVF